MNIIYTTASSILEEHTLREIEYITTATNQMLLQLQYVVDLQQNYDLVHIAAAAKVRDNLWLTKQISIRIAEALLHDNDDNESLPDTVLMTDTDDEN